MTERVVENLFHDKTSIQIPLEHRSRKNMKGAIAIVFSVVLAFSVIPGCQVIGGRMGGRGGEKGNHWIIKWTPRLRGCRNEYAL